MAATQWETCSADALLREFFAQDDLSRLAEGAGALLGAGLGAAGRCRSRFGRRRTPLWASRGVARGCKLPTDGPREAPRFPKSSKRAVYRGWAK